MQDKIFQNKVVSLFAGHEVEILEELDNKYFRIKIDGKLMSTKWSPELETNLLKYHGIDGIVKAAKEFVSIIKIELKNK